MNVDVIRSRCTMFVRTAVVAAVFAAVTATLLWCDFFLRVPDPLAAPSYVELKGQLRANPDREALREQIRNLDLQLREEYFRRRQFTMVGAYLLLGGAVIALIAAKTAATVQRKLPQPSSEAPDQDRDGRLTGQATWGIVCLVLILAAVTIPLRFGTGEAIPASAVEVPAKGTQDQPGTLLATSGKPAGKLPAGKIPIGKGAEQAKAGSVPIGPPPSREQFARNWPRFRGPAGSGMAATAEYPTTWDGASGRGIVWKAPVPLPGNGSPVVWEDRIFLTGATEDRREVYCFDAKSGGLLWTGALPKPPSGTEPPKVMESTGFAASTPATDGRRVYAIFPHGDVAAFDFQGQQQWVRGLGIPQNAYGHASSLATYEDSLIVQWDQGPRNSKMSKLLALAVGTGETVWEAPREVPSCWSTPLVLEHEGKPQVVACGDPWTIAYDARDGKEIWRSKTLRQDIAPSPVASAGIVYVANEFPGVFAIRLGGQGDVTESHLVWSAEQGVPDTTSPLVAGDLLLLLGSAGTLTCYDTAKGGDPLWEEEFEENFLSSPGMAGDKVYLFAELGKSWVVKVSREKCERVAEGNLGEECAASPAFGEKRIYLRGKQHLFCLGDK